MVGVEHLFFLESGELSMILIQTTQRQVLLLGNMHIAIVTCNFLSNLGDLCLNLQKLLRAPFFPSP